VVLERGPLSLLITIEELLGRRSSGSGLESREYGRRYRPRCPRGTLYPQNLVLSSPTSGGLSLGIVRSQIQATEFFFSTNVFCVSLCLCFLLSAHLCASLHSFPPLQSYHTASSSQYPDPGNPVDCERHEISVINARLPSREFTAHCATRLFDLV
jgi:hypothetical protein